MIWADFAKELKSRLAPYMLYNFIEHMIVIFFYKLWYLYIGYTIETSNLPIYDKRIFSIFWKIILSLSLSLHIYLSVCVLYHKKQAYSKIGPLFHCIWNAYVINARGSMDSFNLVILFRAWEKYYWIYIYLFASIFPSF